MDKCGGIAGSKSLSGIPQNTARKYRDTTGTVAVVEGLGQLWLNALRMTIIPLVFSLLVTGIASIADAAATGRLALKAVIVFAVLLVGATAGGICLTYGPSELFRLLEND